MGFSRARRWALILLLAAAVVIAAGYMVSMRDQEKEEKGTLVKNGVLFVCEESGELQEAYE